MVKAWQLRQKEAAHRYEAVPAYRGEESSKHSHVSEKYTRRELWERILQKKTVKPTGCWLWDGAQNVQGYGVMRFYFKQLLAHRASYEAYFGTIPKNCSIMRTCGERLCINPKHLALKTKKQMCIEMIEARELRKDAKWQRKKRDKLRR